MAMSVCLLSKVLRASSLADVLDDKALVCLTPRLGGSRGCHCAHISAHEIRRQPPDSSPSLQMLVPSMHPLSFCQDGIRARYRARRLAPHQETRPLVFRAVRLR